MRHTDIHTSAQEPHVRMTCREQRSSLPRTGETCWISIPVEKPWIPQNKNVKISCFWLVHSFFSSQRDVIKRKERWRTNATQQPKVMCNTTVFRYAVSTMARFVGLRKLFEPQTSGFLGLSLRLQNKPRECASYYNNFAAFSCLRPFPWPADCFLSPDLHIVFQPNKDKQQYGGKYQKVRQQITLCLTCNSQQFLFLYKTPILFHNFCFKSFKSEQKTKMRSIS